MILFSCVFVCAHACMCVSDLDFISPPPLRTSAWEQNVSVLQQRQRTAKGLPQSSLCTVSLSPADVPSFRRYFGAIAGDMSPAASSAAVTINLVSVSEEYFIFFLHLQPRNGLMCEGEGAVRCAEVAASILLAAP